MNTRSIILAASLALSFTAGCIGTDADTDTGGDPTTTSPTGSKGTNDKRGSTSSSDDPSTLPGSAATGAGTPCKGEGIKVLTATPCTAPKGTYVALEGTDRDAIANEMWTVMTNAQCWFKDGSTQEYVFYGNLEYTFWGSTSDSKSFGTLGVVSVGRFEDKNAAVVTIRDENWLIVTLDAATLTIGKYINNAPYIELYKAHNEGRCF